MQGFKTVFDKNQEAIKDYAKKHENNAIGFNVFQIIDTYYKENFHSDILKSFLDLKENGRHKYLRSFIEFLRETNKEKTEHLKSSDFDEASLIERERDRIDISIKNDHSKKLSLLRVKCIMQ